MLKIKLLNLNLELRETLNFDVLLMLDQGSTVADYYDTFERVIGDKFENSQLYIKINGGVKYVNQDYKV